MLRILYSDIYKTVNSKGLKISLWFCLIYPVIQALILYLVVHNYIGGELTGEETLFSYSSIGALLVTAAVLYLTIPDFADGTIKNKIINGVKRSDIFFSSVLSGMFAGVLTSIFCAAGELIAAKLFTKGFYVLTAADVAEYFMALTLASAAVGAFAAMLVMIFGGSFFAYIPGLVIAFFFRVISMRVADKLYPESGVTTLTGTKLKIYTLYDRYFSYAHFTDYLRWDFLSYVIGAAILITISFILGVIIFNRKEFK